MKSIFDLAALFVGVAVLTLLLNERAKTVEVVKVAGETFNSLLRTVTLQ